MSKYVFFRQVSIFLFILFCAMGTGAYAMDAYLEVSPSQPTYKPGDKISLTISVWNGNRKLSGSSGSSESYEWKVQTPSDRSPRQLDAFKETRPKFDYTIPNIEGEYFITCDYLFRLSGSLFSTRLSQKIPVKAQPKQTSADIGTLNGLINCQKTSGEQTQIFHTEEALTFSVVT